MEDPHHWPTVRYEELEPRLRTGDILLFHGASRRSHIVETVTRSEFSHIGMIVTPPGEPPLLWHTDPRAVTEDVLDERGHAGAQLNDLRDALAVMTTPDYGDTPFVRQLIVERTPEMEAAAEEAVAEVEKTSFPSPLKLIVKRLLGHLHIPTSGSGLYCAETLVITYQKMGLLPPKPPPDSYAPRDFSEQHPHLRLLRGATLGGQRRVLWGGPSAR